MRVLGLDPGFARLGYGVVDFESRSGGRFSFVESGMITTAAGASAEARLAEVYDDLLSVIEKTTPGILALEKLYFQNNAKTAIQVAEARGVILLAAAKAGVRLVEFTPPQIKQAVTGYGKATKEQVQEMVVKILKLDFTPNPDDIADALACAIAASSESVVRDAK